MDKSEAIKKLNQMGFKAKDDQNMVYVDLTKISDEEIVDTIFRLQDALKEMEYNKSYGFKYNSSALDVVSATMQKAKDAQPAKEPKEEDAPKRTRTRTKKTDVEKTTPKKETVNKSNEEMVEKTEEKPKRTRRSSKTDGDVKDSSKSKTKENPVEKPTKTSKSDKSSKSKKEASVPEEKPARKPRKKKES